MQKGANFDVPYGIVAHGLQKCVGPLHGDNIVEVTASEQTGSMIRRMKLIWKQIHIPCHPLTAAIFPTHGTSGYAPISRIGGLRQLPMQSTHVVIIKCLVIH
jgi:hypothetical protein